MTDTNFHENNERINECKRFGHHCVLLWNLWFKTTVYVSITINSASLETKDCDHVLKQTNRLPGICVLWRFWIRFAFNLCLLFTKDNIRMMNLFQKTFFTKDPIIKYL